MADLVRRESIECGFLYSAALDGYLHRHIGDDAAVQSELRRYEEQLRQLHRLALEHYDDVTFCVFSDHGMTPLTGTVDATAQLAEFRWGRDYISFIDSTMARFWWINPRRREAVMSRMQTAGAGHFLSPEELKRYHIDFADRRYGDSIYLLDAGRQFVPSDMGRQALPGMHGYTPEHDTSDACFLSNRKPAFVPRWIGDFYQLMTQQGVSR